MNFVVVILNVILISILAYWYSGHAGAVKFTYWLALAIKLAAGIALGLIYTYYYVESDTFTFFNDGVRLATLARTNFDEYLAFLIRGDASFSVWNELCDHQYRVLFLTKVVSVVNLATHDNYWITSVYFSFISFISAWKLVTVLSKYFPALKVNAVVSFLFIPSVVFWSAGIIKESLALAALFYVATVFLEIWMQRRVSVATCIFVLLCLWALWQLKYYYLAVFMPVAATSLVLKFMVLPLLKTKKIRHEIIVWLGIFFLLVFLVSFSSSNFHVANLGSVIVKNHDVFQRFSKPSSNIHYYDLQPTGISLLLNAPWALFSGMFRPFFWEVHNVFQLMFAIENLVILVLVVSASGTAKHGLQSGQRLLGLSIVVYSVVLCVFLALSSPNFGTLSRYRVGFLPFFIFLVSAYSPVFVYFSSFIQRKFSHLVP